MVYLHALTDKGSADIDANICMVHMYIHINKNIHTYMHTYMNARMKRLYLKTQIYSLYDSDSMTSHNCTDYSCFRLDHNRSVDCGCN